MDKTVEPKNTNADKAVIFNVSRHRLSGNRKLILAILIVVVAGLVAGGIIWKQKSDKNAMENRAAEAANNYTTVIRQSSQYEQAGDSASEAKVLKNYLNTNPLKQYLYTPYIRLASLAYNGHKDSQAISYYKKAEVAAGKIQENDAIGIAVAAQAAGDKATAIYYYKQAIKLTDVQPGVANSIDDYKSAIKYLGGTP